MKAERDASPQVDPFVTPIAETGPSPRVDEHDAEFDSPSIAEHALVPSTHTALDTTTVLEAPHQRALLLVMARSALQGAMGFLQSMRGSRFHPEQRPTAPRVRPQARRDDRTDEFMDEKELCETLGISPVTATKWRAKATGPRFVKVGRLVRYRRADVSSWIESRTRG